MKKLLSIIIPTYNMEKYLPRCLESLVSAKVPQAVEVIVINDGSIDKSLAIAKQYQNQRPDIIKIIDKENGNYGSCINVALQEITGKYVKILDADDWFNTEALCDFVEKLTSTGSNVDSDVILTDYTMVFTKKQRIIHYKLEKNRVYDSSILSKSVNMPMHALTFKTSLLKEVQYKQTEGISYTDMEWTFYPFEKVRSLMYLPLNIYQYQLGREGQTMDPKVMFNRIGHNIKIAHRMLEKYSTLEDDFLQSPNGRYMKMMMFANLRKIYKVCLLSFSQHPIRLELNDLNNYIKQSHPEICTSLSLLPIHKIFPFHFIRYYQEKGKRPPYWVRIINHVLKYIQEEIL